VKRKVFIGGGGGVVLINSILSSLPMFMLSFFRFRKVYFKRLTILDLEIFSHKMIVKRRSTCS
jgi:hypothetical protein